MACATWAQVDVPDPGGARTCDCYDLFWLIRDFNFLQCITVKYTCRNTDGNMWKPWLVLPRSSHSLQLCFHDSCLTLASNHHVKSLRSLFGQSSLSSCFKIFQVRQQHSEIVFAVSLCQVQSCGQAICATWNKLGPQEMPLQYITTYCKILQYIVQYYILQYCICMYLYSFEDEGNGTVYVPMYHCILQSKPIVGCL